MRAPAAAEITRFRQMVARRLGLALADSRTDFLAALLARRADHCSMPVGAYLDRLEVAPHRAELAALADELTVGETCFFRDREQFRALRETILPERLGAAAAARPIDLLSAGCASGEEPYSLAMLCQEMVPEADRAVTIRGVDLCSAALAKAALARYSAWSARQVPAAIRIRSFRNEGRALMLDNAMRESVRFEARNLAEDDVELWQPASLDVVLCRNVLMYFTPAAAAALVARIATALRPGGYLLLGHAETLRGLSDAFRVCHRDDAFYYQLRETRAARPAAPRRLRPGHRRPADAHASPPPVAGAEPGPDLAPIIELIRRERFGEALQLLRTLPAGVGAAAGARLLEALLLTHEGSLAPAEAACRRLLEDDAEHAGAHYVLALCRDSAGDPAAAAEHDRTAARLDPGFAMPRLHLGLLAQRAGARAEARRALADAAILLEHESASRVLLFGGGFQRTALVALCRSALRACGGEA